MANCSQADRLALKLAPPVTTTLTFQVVAAADGVPARRHEQNMLRTKLDPDKLFLP